MLSATLLTTLLLAVPAAAQAAPEASARFFWGDLDGDGLRDAFVARPEGGSRLLRNRGDGRFDDVTETVGLGSGGAVREAHWCDFDVDGRTDLLLIAPDGSARLLRRGEEGLFAEVGAVWGLELGAGVLSAHWIDFDADGLEDLHVAGSQLDRLWHNVGASFVEVSLELEPHTYLTASASVGTLAATGLAGAAPREAKVPPGSSSSNAFCPLALRDSNLASCINASAVPTLGQLFPLTTDLNVTLAGRVGIGTSSPGEKLEVIGGIAASGVVVGDLFRSTVGNGTAPFVIASKTTSPNLSADLLDGLDSTAFTQLGGSIESAEITDLTITDLDVSNSAAIRGTKVNPAFGSQNVTTVGDMGAGTSNPLADLHVLGGATLGALMIGPAAAANASSELFLMEDDDGTFGMKLHYDGAANLLEVRGSVSGVDTTHLAIDRSSGDTAIGPSGAVARLTVDGTDDVGQSVVRIFAGDQKAIKATSSDPVEATLDVVNNGSFGTAIYAEGNAEGIRARSTGTLSNAVYGLAQTQLGGHGVHGEATHSVGYGVFSEGDLAATGTKSFLQPHPSDASKSIRFVCLEGNESGTYFRGSAELVGGVAVIEVPEEFRLVSEASGLTVQTQPVGAPAALWIASKDLDRIVVRGNVDVSFDYFVNGVRRGFGEIELVRENHDFVPEVRGVPYGTQFPENLRQILVENGTLNPDYTPNEATAAARGWVLRDPEPVPGARQAPEPLPAPPVDR